MRPLLLSLAMLMAFNGCGGRINILSNRDGADDLRLCLPVCIEVNVIGIGIGIGPYIVPSTMIFSDGENRKWPLGIIYLVSPD